VARGRCLGWTRSAVVAVDVIELGVAKFRPWSSTNSARSVLGALPPDELARERQRATLIISVPELRARALDQIAGALQPFTEAVAERTGREVGEPAVRALTGAVLGVSMSAMLTASEDPGDD
jgi:MftR C-terminal domain